MIYNFLNVISISSNQNRVAVKQVGLLSLMDGTFMVSDLLNSYQSTRVFGTGHHSLPLGGFGGIFNLVVSQ